MNRAEWRCPFESKPPKGGKINILTVGGISTQGYWDDKDCVGWYPLLNTPPHIKERMKRWATGDKTWNK